MKKSSLFALVLGAALAFSPSTQAQEKKDEPKGKGKGPSLEERMKQLTEALKLTDEQKPKVEALLKEQGEKMRAIFQDQGTAQEERRKKMQDLQKDYAAKIKAVLTAEQGEKYDKIQAEIAAKRKKQ